MKCIIVTPAAIGSTKGNRITAQRWSKILRKLGHRVTICQEYQQQQADILIALHARKSNESICRFASQNPQSPILLAMTGTDLYNDLKSSTQANQSLQLATTIIVLQDQAIAELPKLVHDKIEVIYQSAENSSRSATPLKRFFEVTVVGHLREVKDPFLAATAARALPSTSRIRVIHIGQALSASMKKRALREQQQNFRYQWLGELSAANARWRLARSRLTVVSSKIEGGSNVIAEAIVRGVPVLASKISGNIGMLSEEYLGYFPVGDNRALSDLLERAETDSKFYAQLKSAINKRRKLFLPQREIAAWKKLLKSIEIV